MFRFALSGSVLRRAVRNACITEGMAGATVETALHGGSVMSSTSIGRGPAHGSNENHDGDPRNKTLGETASQDEPPIGSDLIVEAAPSVPAGVSGGPQPGMPKGSGSCPDGPNVEASPWELDAAQGKLSKA